MTEWRGYLGIENLALDASQRDQLIAGLRTLGLNNSSHRPERRNHWRTRLDNEAAIFEAAFDDTNLMPAALKARLAAVFSVDPATISHTITNPTFDAIPSQLITFTYSGTDTLRAIAFASLGSYWSQSRAEAKAYIQANAADWIPTSTP